MATAPLPESAYVTDFYGGIIILEADAAIEIARRRDRVAKRARDEGPPLSEEGDSCGWSSSVLERGLALRHRRGPAASSRRGCGWVVDAGPVAAATTEDEHNRGGKESTISDALAAKAAVQQREIDNSNLGYIYLNVIYY